MSSSRRVFLKSLSRSGVALSLENVLGLAYPRWLQAGPAPDLKRDDKSDEKSGDKKDSPEGNELGVSFLNVARESGLNVKTIFGGEHKNKYLLETTGCGVAFYDYDNDGWLDIFLVNGWRLEGFPAGAEPTSHLFRNNRDGTFTDVTAKAGVGHSGWGQGVCVGDYDNDGWDDLFVTYYGKNVLYHNNGDGTFTDVSQKAGVSDPNGYYGFTSVFADLNNDGKVDLLVADDSTPNYLYINKGNGTFEDDSYASGYALNENGRETASMGVAVGDYQNNGRLGLFNTTFSDDYDVLYRNDGDANYTDDSYAAGVAEPTVPFLGWATEFIDFDNDGWKDLFLVNGHVYPLVDKNNWGTTYAERPLLFHNQQGKKFDLVPAVEGSGLALVIPARGAAFGDLFNDGRIDVVINNMDSAPTLLRNVNPDHHHWVELSLIGGAKSPRDAVGAAVYLTAGGLRQRGDVLSGGSFVSSNDPRVHFGLGDSDKVDSVEIHWPSGLKEKVNLPGVDKIFTVEESKGVTGQTCAQCPPQLSK